MNKPIVILMLSLATSGFAQDIEKPFEPKYLQGEKLSRAVDFVNSVMAGRARINWDPVLRYGVISGNADHVAHAEQLLRKFDVPEATPKTCEFTIYLVGAYIEPARARGRPMPNDLNSVIKEMRSAFAYKSFDLLDAIPVTTKPRSRITEYNGILSRAVVASNLQHFYKISMGAPELLENGKTVWTPDFKFTVEIPAASTGAKAGESGIRSDLTVREGQKIVLGKITLDDLDTAVFLVVTVKISSEPRQ